MKTAALAQTDAEIVAALVGEPAQGPGASYRLQPTPVGQRLLIAIDDAGNEGIVGRVILDLVDLRTGQFRWALICQACLDDITVADGGLCGACRDDVAAREN